MAESNPNFELILTEGKLCLSVLCSIQYYHMVDHDRGYGEVWPCLPKPPLALRFFPTRHTLNQIKDHRILTHTRGRGTWGMGDLIGLAKYLLSGE